MPRPAFWWSLAVLGTVLPWLFFASFIAQHGLSPVLFIMALFENGAAAGFSTDILLSIPIFWTWSFFDAKREGVGLWWLTLPAAFTVGLSLALPLYFALRETRNA
ncbi:DUF2834 domain-containing protein [Phaeobacter porticola]|uniref:DUF2834 domain-containing protein n=1 Tax=Phaeobacter porticola TaxID=1844006 RepID=A0A1L3I1Y9_9RHOB|nr:DUF2834 domain-containing protein [Phaeobacter porticola]APG46126.1 hypothetical protein PhaeoP97_00688 [Phaeobacter porticola]